MDPLDFGGDGFYGYGGGSDGGGGFDFERYSGRSVQDPTYLREVEKQIYEILSKRAAGEGVGYDPARRSAQEALIQSSLKRRESDQLRDAAGRRSAAGLSGNLRAAEATSGRIQRDNSQDMSDALSRISIEDLTRANEERDVNTERLRQFNEFNFGQSNKGAQFDLAKYQAEQGLRGEAFDRNYEVERNNIGDNQDFGSTIGQSALTLADIYASTQGVPPGTVSGAANALSSGRGLANPYGQNYSQGGASSIIGRRRRRVGGY